MLYYRIYIPNILRIQIYTYYSSIHSENTREGRVPILTISLCQGCAQPLSLDTSGCFSDYGSNGTLVYFIKD